ncbi:hypothetical protein OF83DRAFT_1087200 [Amylostereum chailletii]|nr:hypothetical protein OF83DRAFT_1087200 [Amylostereum chailletii]
MTLRDKTATRARIIDALTTLKTDVRIRNGDPIFIYYAGHGTTAPTPERWEAGGADSEIQLIVPYDCHTEVAGKVVQAIPDRTIGVLLQQLADEKGDNITVIFDCCHSGSGTRTDVWDPTRLARGFHLEEPLPEDIDEGILKDSQTGRGASVPSGFAHAGLRSHVLLAACGAEEVALEQKGRGIFTRALLRALSVVGADRMTYTDLMSRITDLPRQNPQCEGANAGRILFNSRAPSQGRVLYRVHAEDKKYIMEAGMAHGITEGSEFAIYTSRDPSFKESPLGVLGTGAIHLFSTEMVLPTGATPLYILEHAFALQTRIGAEEALRLHVPVNDQMASVFAALASEMQDRDPGQRTILLVEKDEADIAIALEDGEIVFHILDALTVSLGMTRMYHPLGQPGVDDLAIIRGAAHFYWHLRRSPLKRRLQSRVHVEFTKLVETDDKDDLFGRICVPEGPNLVDEQGRIDIEADDTTLYGMKVINESEVGLYASLFYFDSSDLSIGLPFFGTSYLCVAKYSFLEPYYQQPTSGARPDPSLRPGGSLTIGYGNSGSVPFTYYLRPGQDLDVGFLKLFLSTEPLDLSSIPQESPFHGIRSGAPPRRKVRRIWDAVMIAVVQHRPGRLTSTAGSSSSVSSPGSEASSLPRTPPPPTASHSQASHTESAHPILPIPSPKQVSAAQLPEELDTGFVDPEISSQSSLVHSPRQAPASGHVPRGDYAACTMGDTS